MAKKTYSELAESMIAILAEHVDPDTGEVTPEGMEALQEHDVDKQEWIERMGFVIRRKKAEQAALKEESAYLTKKARSTGNTVDRLTEFLFAEMKNGGYTKVGESIKVSIAKNPAKVNLHVDWENLIPTKYINKETIVNADKKALKQALKAGEKIPGADLVQDERLSIK